MNRSMPFFIVWAFAGCSSSSDGHDPRDGGMVAVGDDAAMGDASGGPDAVAPPDDAAGSGSHRQALIWVWTNFPSSLDAVVQHAESFTHVSPALYQVNYDYRSGAAQFVGNADNFDGLTATQICKRVHDAKLRCVPLLYAGAGNFGTDQGIHNILDDTPAGTQKRFIDSMVAEAQAQGYDGYNLDWEVDNATTPYATYGSKLPVFLSAFRTALHDKGMTLSFDLGTWYIRQSDCSGGAGFADLATLSTAVDLAIIEDYSGTLGGPSNACPAKVPTPAPCDDNVVAQLNLMCLLPRSAVSIGLIDPGTGPFADQALSTIASYGFDNVAVWPDDINHFLDGAPWYSLLAGYLAH